MAEHFDDRQPSPSDRHFVESQIRAHVDMAHWKPDPFALTATPESWRRAFGIAALLEQGVTDRDEVAERLDASRQQIDDDSRLLPYLDRMIAGLLSVLGWYFDSRR